MPIHDKSVEQTALGLHVDSDSSDDIIERRIKEKQRAEDKKNGVVSVSSRLFCRSRGKGNSNDKEDENAKASSQDESSSSELDMYVASAWVKDKRG